MRVKTVKMTSLHIASKNGNYWKVQELLESGYDVNSGLNEDEFSVLDGIQELFKENEECTVTSFLDSTHELSKGKEELTVDSPLHLAVEEGHERVVGLLIDHGATDCDLRTLCNLAIKNDKEGMIQFFDFEIV